MTRVTYTDFREHLADYMNKVCDSRTPMHVTRQGSRSVVVMSEDEYDGLLETVHLLRSPANARRLLAAISEANAGKLKEHKL
jgi:antitoxin YefM